MSHEREPSRPVSRLNPLRRKFPPAPLTKREPYMVLSAFRRPVVGGAVGFCQLRGLSVLTTNLTFQHHSLLKNNIRSLHYHPSTVACHIEQILSLLHQLHTLLIILAQFADKKDSAMRVSNIFIHSRIGVWSGAWTLNVSCHSGGSSPTLHTSTYLGSNLCREDS